MTAEMEYNRYQLAISLPEKADSLRQDLQKEGKLYYEDDSCIVSKVLVNPQHKEDSDVDYCIFEKKNGFPNYRARYNANGRIIEAVVWKYKDPYSEDIEELPHTKNVSITLYVNNYVKNYGDIEIQGYQLDMNTMRFHDPTRSTDRVQKANIELNMTEVDTKIKLLSQKVSAIPKEVFNSESL